MYLQFSNNKIFRNICRNPRKPLNFREHYRFWRVFLFSKCFGKKHSQNRKSFRISSSSFLIKSSSYKTHFFKIHFKLEVHILCVFTRESALITSIVPSYLSYTPNIFVLLCLLYTISGRNRWKEMPTVWMGKTIVFINSGSCVQIANFLSIRSQYGQSNQMAGDSGHVGTAANG